eukprot:scaffold48898_cov60-Phaeocystis_antarctica.AAC.6
MLAQVLLREEAARCVLGLQHVDRLGSGARLRYHVDRVSTHDHIVRASEEAHVRVGPVALLARPEPVGRRRPRLEHLHSEQRHHTSRRAAGGTHQQAATQRGRRLGRGAHELACHGHRQRRRQLPLPPSARGRAAEQHRQPRPRQRRKRCRPLGLCGMEAAGVDAVQRALGQQHVGWHGPRILTEVVPGRHDQVESGRAAWRPLDVNRERLAAAGRTESDAGRHAGTAAADCELWSWL